jgi:hypothetical protein
VSPKNIFEIIEILVTQDYDSRRSAFLMIIDLAPKLNPNQKKKALTILYNSKEIYKKNKLSKKEYENSTLEFIIESIEILQNDVLMFIKINCTLVDHLFYGI